MCTHSAPSDLKPVYAFKEKVPERDLLSAIVQVGNNAPYPPPEPQGMRNIRSFFIFRTGTESCEKLEKICLHALEASLTELTAFFSGEHMSRMGRVDTFS